MEIISVFLCFFLYNFVMFSNIYLFLIIFSFSQQYFLKKLPDLYWFSTLQYDLKKKKKATVKHIHCSKQQQLFQRCSSWVNWHGNIMGRKSWVLILPRDVKVNTSVNLTFTVFLNCRTRTKSTLSDWVTQQSQKRKEERNGNGHGNKIQINVIFKSITMFCFVNIQNEKWKNWLPFMKQPENLKED